MAVPVLPDIIRQHAELAAHLWNVYDWHLRHPDENPDMDEDRLNRLIDRLDAQIDGVRVAGDEGVKIAQACFDAFPEAGELFLLRMLHPKARHLTIRDLDVEQVRAYLKRKLPAETD